VDSATRPVRPHVIPREPPASIVPRPPPPDWALETIETAPVPVARREPSGDLRPWPTSLLTLPSPIYQPLHEAAPRAPAPRRRVGLACLALALAVASLALAFWQLYWFLESSETGRALLDRVSAIVAAVADRF
jgi:hypothetical protein